ncbi:MAG TPA: lasso RiPP family leader peptide-containing protein [Acidimicrobiales bacterium]|jgi:hypothetical protein
MIEQDEAAIVSENEAYEAPTLRTLGTIGEVTKGGTVIGLSIVLP